MIRENTDSGSRKKGATTAPGIQIDVVIRRKGDILTIIECKYSSNPIGKGVIKEVEQKVKFLDAPKKYTIEKVLIAANGVTSDLETSGFFHRILNLDSILGEK